MSEPDGSIAEPRSGPEGGRWFGAVLSIACVVLAGLVALLSVQNLRLKREVSELHERASTRRTADAPQVGQPLKPMTLVDREGRASPLAFSPGQKTLLVIYSADCGYCKAIKPDWRELAAAVNGERVRVIGLVIEPPASAAWPSPTEFPFPVFAVEDPASTDLVRLPLIPATLLLDDRGVVRGAWWGVLDSSAKKAELFAAAGAAPRSQ